nr:threonine/serine exporter family protein [Jeotgalicoccus pinnipedialis]
MVLFGGVAGMMFMMMFKGSVSDLPVTFIAASMGVFITEWIQRYTSIKFFTEVLAAFMIALIAGIYVKLGFGTNVDLIIIAAVMPLVPGVPITNALREIIRGHFLAGTMKGVEAGLTAVAIGAGVGIVFVLGG